VGESARNEGETVMADPKPFHETLVEALNGLEFPPSLKVLSWITVQTVIPKDHFQIAKAFKTAADRLRVNDVNLNNVFTHLESEKIRHEKKAAEKAADEQPKAHRRDLLP
jgi:hypothetical protein